MTKVPVNVPGFTANMAYGVTKVQSTDATGEFGKIFENQKSAATDKMPDAGREDIVEPQEETVKETEPQEVTGGVSDSQKTDEVKETANPQGEQTTADDETESEFSEEEINLIMPMLQTAVGDIKEMLAQELGISQEELDALMESMGLEDMDLLNQGALKDIMLQANGADMMALLTNEDLYGQIQSVESAFEEIMSNVQDTLQMTEEEMNGLKEQLMNMNKEPDVTVEIQAPTQTSHEEAANEQNPQSNPFATPNQEFVNAQNVLSQTSVAQSQAANFMSAQTEQIMNQIMDYMRVQLNAETSTLEMQLQPENLGTLQIRISAKEGIMTAQFTTASETVKAALESQLVQLQQQFENQNIKVEAIEVTVQTHQFESALEQGNERQQMEDDSKRNRVRKIDLNQLEDVEEIPEEDRIVAEMMVASGSTVDYLA